MVFGCLGRKTVLTDFLLLLVARVQSRDLRMMRRDQMLIDFHQEPPCNAPIYVNRCALNDTDERRCSSDNRSLYNESNFKMQISSKCRKRVKLFGSPFDKLINKINS